MKSMYKLKNETSKLTFEYLSNIDSLDSKYEEDVQDCFLQSYSANDIDIKESLFFKDYLKKDSILLAFHEGILVGFILFKFINSIKALDFNIYIKSSCDIPTLKLISTEGILIYSFLVKDRYTIEMFYFNVANKIFYNWIRPILKTGTIIKIRKNYFICYGHISNYYIKNTILEGIEIIKC